MASSPRAQRQEPGLWAEDVQLLLPSDRDCDGKPYDGHGDEAPLLTHLGLLERAQRGDPGLPRHIFLLTSASKIQAFVTLLRSHWAKAQQGRQQLLVGSIDSDNPWLEQAMDVIVATPKQAVNFRNTNCSFRLKALLIDRSSGIPDETFLPPAHNFASSFEGFEAFKHARVFNTDDIPHCFWFCGPDLIRPSADILRLIPGSSPAAWDYPAYGASLSVFAWAQKSKTAVQDWSEVPLFLPGIIRSALWCTAASPPLVLAPHDKVERMINLFQVCASELGLSNFRIGSAKDDAARIRVDCPDQLQKTPDYLDSLLVVDADVLLESASAGMIRRLVGICLNRPVGIHFSTRTRAVDELLKQNLFDVLAQRKVGVQNVVHFSSEAASEEEKVGRVCDITRQLPRNHTVVFCSSGQTVVWLSGEMQRRGIPAFAFCEGDAEIDPEVAFPVIVTNVYRRGEFDVINFDLPDSPEDYVERVGRDRADHKPAKMVINIGSPAQLDRLELSDMRPLPRDCCQLRKILPLLVRFPLRSATYTLLENFNKSIEDLGLGLRPQSPKPTC